MLDLEWPSSNSMPVWAFGRILFRTVMTWSLLRPAVYLSTVFTSSGSEYGEFFQSST